MKASSCRQLVQSLYDIGLKDATRSNQIFHCQTKTHTLHFDIHALTRNATMHIGTDILEPSFDAMMPGIFLALPKLCLLISLTAVEGQWCQAGVGSCVGQRHGFRKTSMGLSRHITIKDIKGSSFDGTFRFADWDGDGDTDVLVGYGGSIWFHERLSNGTVRKNELVQLHAREGQLQSRFEVADWNGHFS